jgi:major membrane immunogen (membrane-anchored lipoprotein)
MSAAGVPQNKIAQALEVPKRSVETAIEKENKAENTIAVIRDKLKLTKMQKALLLEERLWNLADKKIEAEDAKAVDGVLRAIHASEKIQQAVAGESIKIEQKGGVPAVDLAGLIQVLIQQT